MMYHGGKSRHGKRIADIIGLAQPEIYVEPFCGALNVIRHVKAPLRFACDAHGPLIAMWKAAQKGWLPPDSLSRSEWEYLRERKNEHDPLVAFAGFGCSFGGRYFEGYAKNNRKNFSYCKAAKRGIREKILDCSDVHFLHCDFGNIEGSPGVVIYCDPPYLGTKGYSVAFDRDSFLRVASRWADTGAIVLISEASDVPGAELIAEWPVTRNTNAKSGFCVPSRELLWLLLSK